MEIKPHTLYAMPVQPVIIDAVHGESVHYTNHEGRKMCMHMSTFKILYDLHPVEQLLQGAPFGAIAHVAAEQTKIADSLRKKTTTA